MDKRNIYRTSLCIWNFQSFQMHNEVLYLFDRNALYVADYLFMKNRKENILVILGGLHPAAAKGMLPSSSAMSGQPPD